MNQQLKKNILWALLEYRCSKKTESEIAKDNHISRVTLSKYIHIKNITRKHSLYKSPKKPAKKLSKQFKHQRWLVNLEHQLTEYVDKSSSEEIENLIKYILNAQNMKAKALTKLKENK